MNKGSDEDKKAIYNQERKVLIQWFKTITDGKLRHVQALAQLYVLQKKASSIKSLLTDYKDGEGHYSIHFAANRGFNDICEWILSEVPESLESIDENGDSPLSYACLGNQLETVKFLISKGAKINNVTKDRSPIQVACGKSNLDIIHFLLENGADIMVGKESEIGSPLHWAVGEHRLEVARLLLDRGSDINGLNSKGVTPLILASASTDSGMIRLLLEHKADPTIALPDNITPLHIVAESKHVESLKPFLELPTIGELANAETVNHLKPIHFAAESKCLEIVTLLLPHTTGLESTDPKEVMNRILKQIEADKPVEKPVVTLSRGERKICDKRRDDGRAAFNKKNYEKAVECFTAALELDKYDEGLYSNRSAAYLEMGKFKEALEDAKQAVALSPKWAKAHYRLGMAYYKQGLYVDAATAFYAGCELAPANKELSKMFKEALEIGKREHSKEMQEASERQSELKQ